MNDDRAIEEAAALASGTAEVISPAELAAKIALGRPLRIKLGMDPTAPDLHLGHSLTLKKLRDFQRAGHTVIFLVGDFTAMIGDPTGRSETRKPLSREQIESNAETYRAQAFKILDRELTEVRFNSEWMNELGVRRLIEIAAKVSVARLLERDDFEKRLAAEEPLFLHELLYPVIQGYDSVALEQTGDADVRGNLDQAAHAHLVHPFAVEADLGQFAIENLVGLRAIGLGVAIDLLARQRLARLVAARGIADHRGKVADEKNHGVAGVLKIAQFFEHDTVAEMEVGRRRIHSELDSQRAAELEFGPELGRRNDLDSAAGKRRHLFIRLVFLHGALRHFRSLEFRWHSSVQEF